MKKIKNTFKITIGFVISGLFLYIAFRKINFSEMKQAFANVNYLILLLTIFFAFFSHWLRSMRWQYFLRPIKKISAKNLFSALLIGYLGNTVLPAHLGELFRGYVIGRKEKISTSSVMATIVLERIIDVFSLLLLMGFTLIFYPFPTWVKKSGYIMFFLTFLLFLFLLLLKRDTSKMMSLLNKLLKFLPKRFSNKIEKIIVTFIDGIKELKQKRDYLKIIVLSILIWTCYWLMFCITSYAFNLFQSSYVIALSSIVLLVITTISIVIPSSPGYVGTYHFLCQLSLELFGVSSSVALSYAIVVHAITFFPIALVGLIFAWKEGLGLMKLNQTKELSQNQS